MLLQVYATLRLLARERWWANLSAAHDQVFSMDDRSGDRAGQTSIEYPENPERSKHDLQYVILKYLVGRWYLAGL